MPVLGLALSFCLPLALGSFELLSRTCQEDVRVMEFPRGAQGGPQLRGRGAASWCCCCRLIQCPPLVLRAPPSAIGHSCPMTGCSPVLNLGLPLSSHLSIPGHPAVKGFVATERTPGSFHRLDSGLLTLFLSHSLWNFFSLMLIKKTYISLSEPLKTGKNQNQTIQKPVT